MATRWPVEPWEAARTLRIKSRTRDKTKEASNGIEYTPKGNGSSNPDWDDDGIGLLGNAETHQGVDRKRSNPEGMRLLNSLRHLEVNAEVRKPSLVTTGKLQTLGQNLTRRLKQRRSILQLPR